MCVNRTTLTHAGAAWQEAMVERAAPGSQHCAHQARSLLGVPKRSAAGPQPGTHNRRHPLEEGEGIPLGAPHHGVPALCHNSHAGNGSHNGLSGGHGELQAEGAAAAGMVWVGVDGWAGEAGARSGSNGGVGCCLPLWPSSLASGALPGSFVATQAQARGSPVHTCMRTTKCTAKCMGTHLPICGQHHPDTGGCPA